MEQVNVILDSWIIQDGNYYDFKVGDEAVFALEFYFGEVRKIQPVQESWNLISEFEYHVTAKVLYRSKATWVIDFGLMAYQEFKDPTFAKGDWIEGTLSVGIDPYFYASYLKDEAGIPWIKYKFRIDEILLNTTPWLENDRMRYRDESRISFESVEKTNAWNDDNGHGSYILKCVVIEPPEQTHQSK